MKRQKALIDSKTYLEILDILREPNNTDLASPQFRFWVRKTFLLDESVSPAEKSEDGSPKSWVALHDGKRVALREELYAIICEAHEKCGHGGRDTTLKEVKSSQLLHVAFMNNDILR
jgi:hypothetical protein